jgi:hypothetical protein
MTSPAFAKPYELIVRNSAIIGKGADPITAAEAIQMDGLKLHDV